MHEGASQGWQHRDVEDTGRLRRDPCLGQGHMSRADEGYLTHSPTGYPQPNQGVQLTAYSVRSAPASGSS